MTIRDSSLGWTVNPVISGFRIESVFAKIRAEASYFAGTTASAASAIAPAAQAVASPSHRWAHIPLRAMTAMRSVSSMARAIQSAGARGIRTSFAE